MQQKNNCLGCIEKVDNECCVDVYLILNPNEVNLFKNYPIFKKVKGGGIFYTTQGCPYFKKNSCQIHNIKPLYCKYYPIYITGQPFVDEDCKIHLDYKLTANIKREIRELQRSYPVYQAEWFWEDVKKELQLYTRDEVLSR